ncbi:hypothetical protein B0H11DRAFT_2094737 [Mycena galericulata]|nr:hypothetical protein B0H11DRAFT_2094737 [Mycena galericulata]
MVSHFESAGYGRLLLVVIGAFSVTNGLFLADRSMAIGSAATSAEFESSNEVVRIAITHLISTGALMLTLEHILSAIPTKSALKASFVLFEVGSALYSFSDGAAVGASGRVAMGLAALLMCTLAARTVREIPSLFERPGVLAYLGGCLGILVSLGPFLDELLLDTISNGRYTHKIIGKWMLYANSPMAAISLYALAADVSSLNPHAKLSASKGTHILALFFAAAIIAAQEWTGTIQPIRDIAIRINLGFCVAFLAVIMISALYQKLASNPSAASKADPQIESRPKTYNNIIFGIVVMLVSGVYYLPIWFRARGQNGSLAGLSILPFIISTVFSLVFLTALKNNPFESMWRFPAAMALLLPAVYVSGEQVTFFGTQIISGAGVGAGIRYSLSLAEVTEFSDSISSFVEAASL